MKKWIVYLFLVIGHSVICFGDDMNINTILEKYPSPTYQDIVVQNQVLVKGINSCDVRYRLIKPILDLFQTPFSVLDLGAAQGYFSFRIAHEYPHAHCTMIDENSYLYRYHGDLLYDLCLLNKLENVVCLRKRMSYNDLCFLNHRDHFDVVIALLVVHQMAEKLSDQQMFVERLLSLGDYVILEVADDVAVDLAYFIASLREYLDCEYLGQMPRFQNPHMPGRGALYCFKGTKITNRQNRQGISKESFHALNGVYSHNAFVD